MVALLYTSWYLLRRHVCRLLLFRDVLLPAKESEIVTDTFFLLIFPFASSIFFMLCDDYVYLLKRIGVVHSSEIFDKVVSDERGLAFSKPHEFWKLKFAADVISSRQCRRELR